eukprot:4217680-Pyramimonas_sp.AAC.1
MHLLGPARRVRLKRRAAFTLPRSQMLAGPQLPVGLPTGHRGFARARGAAGHRLIDCAAAGVLPRRAKHQNINSYHFTRMLNDST